MGTAQLLMHEPHISKGGAPCVKYAPREYRHRFARVAIALKSYCPLH